MGDTWDYFGPNTFYKDYSIHEAGELPLWNPLILCGQPFAANPQSGLFYPLDLVRSLFTPDPTPAKTHVGMAFMLGVHMVLAGLGMFALGRDHGLSKGGSLVAACAFVFSASVVRCAVAHHFIETITWFPLLLLLLRRARSTASTRARVRYALVGGLVFGVGLLGGAAQIVTYECVALGAYLVLQWVLGPNPEGERRLWSRVKLAAGDVAVLALLGVVGGLVSAAMMVPAAEYAGHTSRLKDSMSSPSKDVFDRSPKHVFESVLVYPGPKNRRDNFRASGVVVWILALGAFTHSRRRPVLLYLGLLVVLFDCSLGPPFPLSQLVAWVTPFQMVAPSRAFLLACLPIGMLAGFGADALTVRLKSRWKRGARTFWLAVSGGCLALALCRALESEHFLSVGPHLWALPVSALVVALIGGWIPLAGLWRSALVVLVLAETASWNLEYVRFLVSNQSYRGEIAPLSESHRLPLDNRRHMEIGTCNELMYRLRPTIIGYDPLYISRVRQVIGAPRKQSTYKRGAWWKATSYRSFRSNLFLKRQFWLARTWVEGPLPPKTTLFPGATTVFLEQAGGLSVPQTSRKALVQSSVSDQRQQKRIAGAKVLESLPRTVKRPRRSGGMSEFVLPTASLSGNHSALVLTYKSRTTARLEVAFHDPTDQRREGGKSVSLRKTAGKTAQIEIPLPDFAKLSTALRLIPSSADKAVQWLEASIVSDGQDEDDRIEVVEYGPNSVTVKLHELPGHRILTFTDGYYPGWRAYLDSAPAPILLANEAFKAVEVPPGNHEVRFVFRPVSVYSGMAISLATVLTVLVLLCWVRPGFPSSSAGTR